MGDKTHMQYNVDTNTASVKMTSGVPVTGAELSDSSSDEIEDSDAKDAPRSLAIASETKTGHVISGTEKHKENTEVDRVDHIAGQTKCSSDGDPEKSLSESAGGGKIKKLPLQSSTHLNRETKINTATRGIVPDESDNCSNRSRSRSGSRDEKQNKDNKSKSSRSSNYPIYIPKPSDRKRSGYGSGVVSSEHSSEYVTVSSSLSPTEQSQLPRLSQSLENNKVSTLKRESGMVTSNSLNDITSKSKYKQSRVNPFNNELHLEEDHFSDTMENYFRTDRHSSGSTKSSSQSQGMDWWHDGLKSDINFAELGLSEDHFSHPQGHFGLSRAEELELAIENCKEMIRDAPQDSDKQKNLVLKLVQLRIKLQEIKEGPEPVPENVKVILSHKMVLKNSRTSKYYCERCNGGIWGMLQVWYRCSECGYRCHEKCLQQILRTCAKAKVLENPTLIMEICPKEPNGLASQNFRCAECRSAISFKAGQTEPRQCDYTGRFYCEFCHWNDTFIIPARVLHNWDFTPYKVCRASKQFLKLMQKKAVIRIQDVNPMLFVYVDQLNEIKKLREEMMIMKKYILSCPKAMASKLLLLLETRQHFVESSDRYSMQDLLDSEDVLLPELVSIHSTWAQHIKVDCELCQGRGFCCEICGEKEVLFPFDNIAVVCPKCSYVLHRHCFAKKCICPRCERRKKRKEEKS